MMFRRSQQIAAVVAGTLVPLTVSAQNGASVTVAPLGTAAPAAGLPLLGLLALLLAIVAVTLLRRDRTAVRFATVLFTVAMVAGVGYSLMANVVVSGDECGQVTVKPYDRFADLNLESECANPIQIIDLEIECNGIHKETLVEGQPLPDCQVGLVLNFEEACILPSCDV
jgi:hypothetical protein